MSDKRDRAMTDEEIASMNLAPSAEREFQNTHNAFLVVSGEIAETSVMRDADGRVIGLTVALQGEGEFVIPLHRNGDRPAK